MTNDEYQRICDRLARKAIRFATKMVADEESGPPRDQRRADGDAQCEHWIHVFLDEHLPDIDADAPLEVTLRADAWRQVRWHRYVDRTVRAIAAFQADVRDAISRMEAA